MLPTHLTDKEFVHLGSHRPQALKLVHGAPRVNLSAIVSNYTFVANKTAQEMPLNATATPQTNQTANVTEALKNATNAANAADLRILFLKNRALQRGGRSAPIESDPIGSARIVAADILCSNGVLHLIDRGVQFPIGLEDTLESANLTEYARVLKQSGALEKLKGMNGITIFATTNAEITQLQNLTLKEHNQSSNTSSNSTSPGVSSSGQLTLPSEVLKQIIEATVVPGVYYSTAFNHTSLLNNTQGAPLHIGNGTHAGNATWWISTNATAANATAGNATTPAGNATAANVTTGNATGQAHHILASHLNATALNVTEWTNTTIIYRDLLFDGGVIHILQHVLLTPALANQLQAAPYVPPPSFNASMFNDTFAARMCDSLHGAEMQQKDLANAPPPSNATNTTQKNIQFWVSALLAWVRPEENVTQTPAPQHPQQQQQPHLQQPSSVPKCPATNSLCFVVRSLPQVCATAYKEFKQVNDSFLAMNATKNGTTAASPTTPPSNATGNATSPHATPQQLTQQFLDAEQHFLTSIAEQQVTAQCFDPKTHICIGNTFLCPLTAPQQCGGLCYHVSKYACTNHFTLCPKKNAADCSGACYSPDLYQCVGGKLQQHQNATEITQH